MRCDQISHLINGVNLVNGKYFLQIAFSHRQCFDSQNSQNSSPVTNDYDVMRFFNIRVLRGMFL